MNNKLLAILGMAIIVIAPLCFAGVLPGISTSNSNNQPQGYVLNWQGPDSVNIE
ncbi:hypothetical protein [Kordiimonas aquimaris]|uniref:hypothetical protein n=1 Tax=Kordiimonas aquimaris TaxID=707591 RepID=UPI0021D1A3AC|nr:hypothetical protein [Kordiimonas aquimaris]